MTETPGSPGEPRPGDDLLGRIQLRVAQRADEISRERSNRVGLNLECWLLAEAEVFREALASGPVRPRMLDVQTRAG